ncbi:DNA/RNA helicase domain-containing protein [Streptosporangium sp. NPDC023615]|uniref:DNA/RNA helicase domain-containing protein n=1 Tax=Streptosporangium sp. NPDC023615 TaxID=3154794 RepID=UPI00343EC1C3
MRIDLRSQFRCGGDPEYIHWFEQLLGLVPGEPPPGGGHWRTTNYTSPPEAMEKFLNNRAAETNSSARIAVGFCWPWSSPARTVPSNMRIGSHHAVVDRGAREVLRLAPHPYLQG